MKKAFYITATCFFLFNGFIVATYGQKKNSESGDIITTTSLAQQLTEKCTTDKEKVTVIFRWITDNISYNIKAISKNKNEALPYNEPEDTSTTLQPLNERVAEMVLQRRVAICDGYARLFKSLCDHAGIRSEVIAGYARVNFNSNRYKFRSNHKWNAVFIDSSWYLLDATWASGYISYPANEFVKEYEDGYFLTSPEKFINDHYPEDLDWTLLKNPPTLSEFYKGPFRYMGYVRSGIISYFPVKGIVEAKAGDTIRFEVESYADKNAVYVATQPPVESEFDEPPVINGHKKIVCTYAVTDNSPEWLYVVCDGETILRYKLNVKKTESRAGLLSSK